MTSGNPALVFALYSEDRADSKRNLPTLREVLCSMLKLVHVDARIHHLDFRPAQDRPARRISGSYWKVRKSRDLGAQERRRTLIDDIATALLRGHVVYFHVDGDCCWQEQDKAEVWRHLDRFRRDLMEVGRRSRPGKIPIDHTLLEEAFIVAVPFWCMESWTYSNLELLRTHTSHSAELEHIDRWTADLARLDEEQQIKDRVPSIRDGQNAELAKGLPAGALLELGKSYAATVARLQRSPRVVKGLEESATRPW